MKTNFGNTLRVILQDTVRETESARSKESFKRVKQMAKDAPPVLPFKVPLACGAALIAEIKEKSPSQGAMLLENVRQAVSAYKQSRAVKAISVLTNRKHFGQGIETLRRVKRECASKPLLRKDFITDEYQVYQSRAYGADAILLMVNILERDELDRLSSIAFELGMDVLFETHRASELQEIPPTANIVGINCRNFESTGGFKLAKVLRQWLWANSDKTVNTRRFDYAEQLPAHIIRIAESGVTPKNCAKILSMGFHAVLVGTSLLMDTRGVREALGDFEKAMVGLKPLRSDSSTVRRSAQPALVQAMLPPEFETTG